MSIENMLVEAHWKKISLGKYYFPADFHFACCESQGFYYFVSWWFTAWAWCWHNCPKRCQIFRRPKQTIRPRQNAPSLCRILKLRESSSEQVLNNKRQKRCLHKYFPFGGLKKVTRLQIFNTGLYQVYGYQQLSLIEDDLRTKNDQIYNIFKCKRKILFTAQISFILGANCRYIFYLQNIVRWFTGKHF